VNGVLRDEPLRPRLARRPTVLDSGTTVTAMAELGTQLDIEPGDGELGLTGEIDAHTAPRLEAAISERFASGATTVRLGFEGVTFMDSSGLRVVIAATESARNAGGDLILVRPTQTVSRLLDVSGLSGHLTVSSGS
jgi:anti-sigma B factor antagonist